jgi:hypothetical protein
MAMATVAVALACAAGDGLSVGDVEFRGPAGSVTPFLSVAGDDPILSWLEPTSRGHALRVAVRADTGWETVGTIVGNDSLFVSWADFPSVTPLDDGSWLAHWLQKTAPSTYAYHVRMSISRDSGRSWGPPFAPHGDTSATEHGFVSVVPWGDGAATVWLDGRNTAGGTHHPPAGSPGQPPAAPAMSLRFTTVALDGAPAPDREIDARACDCCQTDLAVTGRGLVAVYRDRTDDEIRDVVATRLVNDGWTTPRPVAADGWHITGCPVNGPQVAARGDSVVVAWFTAAADTARVQAAFSFDAGESFGPAVLVNEGRPTGRVDVVWWGGQALISWLEETAEQGMVRVRRLSPTGDPGPAVTVARTTTARASGFPRMAVVPEGVLMGWTEPGESGGVRVAMLHGGR